MFPVYLSVHQGKGTPGLWSQVPFGRYPSLWSQILSRGGVPLVSGPFPGEGEGATPFLGLDWDTPPSSGPRQRYLLPPPPGQDMPQTGHTTGSTTLAAIQEDFLAYYYHRHPKDGEGNVFTGVGLFTGRVPSLWSKVLPVGGTNSPPPPRIRGTSRRNLGPQTGVLPPDSTGVPPYRIGVPPERIAVPPSPPPGTVTPRAVYPGFPLFSSDKIP